MTTERYTLYGAYGEQETPLSHYATLREAGIGWAKLSWHETGGAGENAAWIRDNKTEEDVTSQALQTVAAQAEKVENLPPWALKRFGFGA